MSSSHITLAVRPRGKPIKKVPEEAQVRPQDSTAKLYETIAARSGCSVHRLKITKGSDGTSLPNAEDVTIERVGLREQSTVYVKDLGPQIAWRTVFIVEYLGPLLIHPLFYLLRPYIYRTDEAPTSLQTLSLVLITIHFIKRELETVFVHRFSLATMPARNIVKNSFHYWALAGLNIAYWIYAPNAPTAKPLNPIVTLAAIGMFAFGEAANFLTHLRLRGLRSSGGKERGIPTGYGFDTVTCPNYLWETVAWAGILLVTRSWGTVVFVLVAVGQMMAWAKKKENKYRRDFGDRYTKKKHAMFPGLF
ncbi:MAG: 3-oxo-5a-steroid 4- dehydrogenase [Caeruleum heppii]|nr:MAG: 3-oxo-5a-steroid 4- dehydrogenase [Caeruleum heppii]